MVNDFREEEAPAPQMAGKPQPAASDAVEQWATVSEVLAAVSSLTPTELLRLKSFARYRIRGLGAGAQGATYEDLLSEAMTATLAGSRRWHKKNVDFPGHLCGVMRSISSHWGERAAGREVSWTDTLDLGGGRGSPSSPAASDRPGLGVDAERWLAARQEVRLIREYFAGDDKVTRVLDLFAVGYRGPEVKERLMLTQTEYETIMKRMRRGVERLMRRTAKEAHHG